MTKIGLNCFNIITVLKGQNCKGMTEIMDSGVGDTDFFCNLFEAQIGSLRDQVMPDFVGENKSTFVLFFVLPSLPRRTGYKDIISLLSIQ